MKLYYYGVVNIHSSFAVVYSADSHTLVVIEEFLKKGKGRCSDQKDYKDRNHGYLKFIRDNF